MTNKQTEAQLEADQWNSRYPIGIPVEVTRDNGEKSLTCTRSIAWEVCGRAVVLLEGIGGGYLLSRVRAIEEKMEFFEAVYSDITMKVEDKIHWLYKSCQHLNSLLKKEESMEGFTEGRMVHFVMPDGEHRAAVVVRVWRPQVPERLGYCNLSVFTDWGNDGPGNETGFRRETSILYSEAKEPGTWHWIEREA
jgi:hypothetical protein